nr:RNA-directed DNA polymerase, eukaryota [Tanacetum cinerariifolium]
MDCKKGINLHREELESKLVLVLDDSCLNQNDMSTALMGKVKVFDSLWNLKPVLANEGSDDIKLKYMSGLWVLIEFQANSTMEKFMANSSVASWFSHLQQTTHNVFIDERVIWLDIEEVCGWSPDFVEEEENESEYDDVVSKESDQEANGGLHNPKSSDGDSDVEEVSHTIYEKSRVFRKDNSLVSHYFVTVRGEWIQNAKMILIISVYVPQKLSEEKMLWDYLSLVIGNWQGDVIIMGDFNEVRKQEKIYGTVFNVHGADAFSLFILNAGITLDRYLSDHHPILMSESKFDYGKIPEWTKVKRVNANKHKTELKEQLAEIDILIDKGEKSKIKWGIEGDENSKYYH